METPRVRLGELLVRAGLLTAGQLEEALAEQRRNGKRLGATLVESGLVSETQVTQILSQQLSVPWVALHHIDFSRELLNLVPMDLVERYCLIPIYVRRLRGIGDALYVAMEDPTNTQALDEVRKHSGLHVRPMIAPPNDILSAIRAYYGVGPGAAPQPAKEPDVEANVSTGLHNRVDAASAERALADAEAARVRPAPPATEQRSSPSAAGAPAPAPGSHPRAALRKPPGSSPKAAREAPSSPSSSSGEPPPSSRSDTDSRRVARKMIALTLLDGTQIRVPAKPKKDGVESDAAAPAEEQLTARDLVAALRAAGRGVDASEILGDNARWESMLAAILSLLLKKHLVADWEFVEEYKKS